MITQRAQIEGEIKAPITALAEMSRPFEILVSVPGVGLVMIDTLVAELPNSDADLAARSSLASGLRRFRAIPPSWRGYRAIHGRHADVHCALFQRKAAMAARLKHPPASAQNQYGCYATLPSSAMAAPPRMVALSGSASDRARTCRTQSSVPMS